MKTAVYYKKNGAIQQVSHGPEFVEFPNIDGLSLLLLDGTIETDGKIVARRRLVDGSVDERTEAQKLNDLQNRARGALNESGWIVERSYEYGEPVPQKWAVYREALRNIVRMTEYSEVQFPAKPS